MLPRGRGAAPRVALPLLGLLPACSAALLVLGTASTARALPLVTISGSARGLYGSPADDLRLNPYGGGIGLRLGVTLPASLYLGGSFDYFFGESETNTAEIEQSVSLLQVMARVGYDLGIGSVTLRPQLGLGLAQSAVDFGGLSTSESDFALAPGAEFIFGLGLLSLSAEANYNVVFAGDEEQVTNAWILGLGLGVSF
ncbi:MAG TPA: outer membrane beta-barrel protein [Polyangiaceae bacterium]|nr:outer membrane beta-barrel protein [Polyangiaceae bacterium]